MDKYLAAVCAVCPFCLAKRKWPRSAFARGYRKVERFCPFCRAYGRMHAEGKVSEPEKSRP